jgi:hypothetical protein
MFRLTVDKVFPPPGEELDNMSRYKLLSYSDTENLWDFVLAYPKKKDKSGTKPKQ